MNNDVEYVLRLVLKARDDMSGVLAKARAELALFKSEADDLNSVLDDTNKRYKKMADNVRNVRTELAQLRKASDDTGGSVRTVVVATEDLADASDSASAASRRLNEADRASLETSQRSLRASRERTSQTKKQTQAVKSDAEALIASGEARKYAIQNLKLEADAATNAAAELTKLKKARSEEVKDLSRARRAGGLPAKDELTDEVKALLNPDELKQLDRLQKLVDDAKKKEADQSRVVQAARKKEVALIAEAADEMVKLGITEVQVEEAASKSKNKTADSTKKKTEATKADTVAEKENTEAVKKQTEAEARRERTRKSLEGTQKAARETGPAPRQTITTEGAIRKEELAEGRREAGRKRRAAAEKKAVEVQAEFEAKAYEDEADKFVAAESKKEVAAKKTAKTRKQLLEEANREMFAGIHDDPHGGRVEEDVSHLVRHEHEVDIGDRFAEQGGADFGGGFGLGGGAPRKTEVEKQMARDRTAMLARERRELTKLETEYQITASSLGDFLGLFRKGDIDVDTFIKKVQGLERQFNSYATKIAKISSATPKQLQDILGAPERMHTHIETMLAGKPAGEELGRALGKSDVASTNEKVAVSANKASIAEKTLSKSFDDAEQKARDFRDRMHEVYTEFDRKNLSAEQAATAIADIGTSLGHLRRAERGSPLGIFIGDIERDAKGAAQAIRQESSEHERDSASTRRNAAAHAELSSKADDSLLSYRKLMSEIRSGNVHWITARNQLHGVADEMSKLSRRFTGIDTHRELQLGQGAEDARRAIAGLNREQHNFYKTEQVAQRMTTGLAGWFNRLAENADRAGGSVARIDNELRGMMVLAVLSFAEQLVTAMMAAVGALTSLASSAIFAGGALGGALVAGLAQAIPMLGLFVASFARVKEVMNAVQQSQLVDQQRFQRQDNTRKKQADTADAVANAEEGVKNAEDGVSQAHRRLSDAQRNLTDARRDAARQLRDLISAERDAELQARGAALAQTDAQEALRQAVTGGDVSGLAGAEQRVLESRQANREAQDKLRDARADRRRLVPRGVEGQDNVRQARQQVQDARKAIDQADSAVTKAARSLEKAKRGSDMAAADSFSGLEKLQWLLQKRLSPAERELYERINKLQTVYRRQFRPVTDIFINEYTKGVNTAIRLLEDKRIISTAKNMATGIAGELGKVRRSFTDNTTINQFTRIMRDGQKNLKPLGEIVRNLGHAFLNIAEEAAPALHRILEWFDGLSKRILNLTGDRVKMGRFFDLAADNAIAWLNAIEAIVKMLATLAGVAQGEGFSMIKELTDWANRTTQSIKDNRGEVAQFFKDSHEILKIFLSLMVSVGKAMLEVFSPGRLSVFAEFLKKDILPALVTAMKLMGAFSTALLFILTLPGFSQAFKLLVTLLLVSKVVTSLRTLWKTMNAQLATFFAMLDKPTGGGFSRWTQTLGNNFKGILSSVGELLKKIPLLNKTKIPEWFSRRGASRPGDILPEAQVPGGKKMPDGSRAPYAYPGSEPGGTTVAPIPGGRGAPGERERLTRRQRAGRIGKGVGVAGLLAGGAYAMTRGDARDLQDISSKSNLGVGVDVFSGVLGSNILDIGSTIKQLFGGANASQLKDFARTFETELTRLTRKRDVKGLADLGNHARDLAEQFPKYADALNAAADQTDQAQTSTKDLNKQLGATKDIAGTLSKQGIDLSVNIRGTTPKNLLDDISFYLTRLRQGIPRNMKQLGDEVRAEIGRINEAFAPGGNRTAEWYTAMTKTHEAAIKNILRLRREGKISADDARKQILDLSKDIKLFNAQNPWEIGEGFANSIVKTKGSRQKAINDILADLGKMPEAARHRAAETAIGIIKNLEKKRPELRGTAKLLASEVGKRFRGMRDINIKRSGQMVSGVATIFAQLPPAVTGTIQAVGDSLNSLLSTLGFGKVKFHAPKDFSKTVGKALGGGLPGIVSAFTDVADADGAAQGRIGKKGMRGRDARPTWLGDGELVLNHWHEAALNTMLPGQETVEGVVSRVRGFHAGGFGDNIGFAAGGYALGGIHEGIRKAALSILNKYPQLMVTSTTGGGHAANSYHYKGMAVDIGGPYNVMNRAARWIAGSSLAHQLTEGIHNPGLSIKGGQRVAPGFWGSTTWANHANHIHIAVAGAIGKIIGGAFQHLKRQRWSGPDGAIKDILQGVTNRAVRASNRYLDSQGGTTGDTESHAVSGGMGKAAVTRVINQAMQIVGIPRNIRGAWRSMAIDRAYQESGYNPNAQNNWDSNAAAGHPSKGLFQTIDSTFGSYKVGNHNNILAPLDNTLAAFKYMLAAYGRGSWALALSRMLGRKGVGYAAGGPVPGFGGGDQWPAMLEGGEHVWTKDEVQKAGGHGIMRALRKMLGGGGQGGPVGYLDGGDVAAIDRPFTSTGMRERLRDVQRGRYALPVLSFKDWTDAVVEMHRASVGLRNSGKIWHTRIKEINADIKRMQDSDDKTTKDEAASIKKLVKERTDLQRNRGGARTQLRRGGLLKNIDAITGDGGLLDMVDTAREHAQSLRQRRQTFSQFFERRNDRTHLIRRRASVSPVAVARAEMFDARNALEDVESEEHTISNTRRVVQNQLKRLRRGGVKPKEAAQVRKLETQLTKLNEDYDNIRDAHAEALQAAYEAQVAASQAAIDDINKRAEDQTAVQEGVKRIASLFGQNGIVDAANSAERDIMQKQADELKKQIPAAAAMGNTEMVSQLTQQINDLQSSITESLAQSLRDAADQINNTAQRRMGRLDLFGRMQSALGKMGLGSVVNVGGEAFSAAGVQQQRMDALTSQRSGLQGLLQRVMTEQPQNVQLIQDLTDQLAELDVTIQENTKAWFDARVEDVNATFGRGNTTLDLRKQIVELQGQITGTPDSAKLLGYERERTVLLKNQADSLQALLDEAIAAGNDQAVNDLTDQLLQNQIATLQNTVAINDLTGATTQPQGFQSSSWEWFREAIFTGMGDVLPQYIVPGAASGGIVTKSGLAMVHTGEPIVPANIAQQDWGSGGGGDTFNFEINEAGGPIDYVELASTVAWAKKTAQTPRK